jgi:hypothetical protein
MFAKKNELSRTRRLASKSWTPSAPWNLASNALGAGATVLLVGAVWSRITHDSAAASTLFNVGVATEVGMVVAFIQAMIEGRRSEP